MRVLITLFTVAFCLSHPVIAQQIVPLYPGHIPNSKPTENTEKSEYNKDSLLIISNITRPQLAIYQPDKKEANGVAVIICPGGAYMVEAAGHEGVDVAKKLNSYGVTGIVLKYRLPNDSTMINKKIGPIQDLQTAIQYVREHAKSLGIDKNKIGVMGFSAGGHLAAMSGVSFNRNYTGNKTKTSLRPDFMALVYPVISFTDSIGHAGSRQSLLGAHPTQQEIWSYSNEFHVNAQTPPSFLVHAKDDFVNYKNSAYFADSLRYYQVPVKTQIYEKGGHGFGMYNKQSSVSWMPLLIQWLSQMKFIQ